MLGYRDGNEHTMAFLCVPVKVLAITPYLFSTVAPFGADGALFSFVAMRKPCAFLTR
jgi:hypothetical protein